LKKRAMYLLLVKNPSNISISFLTLILLFFSCKEKANPKEIFILESIKGNCKYEFSSYNYFILSDFDFTIRNDTLIVGRKLKKNEIKWFANETKSEFVIANLNNSNKLDYYRPNVFSSNIEIRIKGNNYNKKIRIFGKRDDDTLVNLDHSNMYNFKSKKFVRSGF